MGKADIGMIGLAVMGANLARNMERNGYRVAVWNNEPQLTGEFMSGPGFGKNFAAADTLEQITASLDRPRKVMMMIRAGTPVDEVIERLLPLLDEGDIVIDGGNSNFEDTQRRYRMLKSKGIRFVGTGVSGGEEGALYGPSLMPGGDSGAWNDIRPLFEAISAKCSDGTPCCRWIGEGGAGHFVKMIHNGIEYGDMQLICEAYHILRTAGYTNDELHKLFSEWNSGKLSSYLMEITADIFAARDDEGNYVLDSILDRAGQKNTGMWAVKTALEMGNPLSLIAESVFARMISARRSERLAAATILTGPEVTAQDKTAVAANVKEALLAARIVSYAQGFSLIGDASAQYGWNIDKAALSVIWQGGCIIRSALLKDIAESFRQDPELRNLMLDARFARLLGETQAGWRETVSQAVGSGVPVPAFSSALAYYDSYRCDNLPANLLQAQRDYFGAHTYERIDRPEGEFFHTVWKK